VALLSNGKLVTWGVNAMAGWLPDLSEAPGPNGQGRRYVQISCGSYHDLAVLSDGSLAGWGANGIGQCDAPPLPPGVTIQSMKAGTFVTGALLSDGTIRVWGAPNYGMQSVPPLPPGLVYVDFDLGKHALALRSDGELFAWGNNSYGHCCSHPRQSRRT
jgi:alpha-tubulin suppressor-like RCC1 family protein